MFNGAGVVMPSLLGISYLPKIRANELSRGLWTDLGEIVGSIPVHSHKEQNS